MLSSPASMLKYFDGEKQSIIPLFQRPYTWSTDRWQILWDDVILQYEDQDSVHFMGAIVSMPQRSNPVGVSKWLIIDGQQRLATICILLAAIREFDSTPVSLRDRIHEGYLVNRHHSNAIDYVKFLPTVADQAAFNFLITKNGSRIDDHPMTKAFDFFKEKIKTTELDDGSGTLQKIDVERLFNTLFQQLQIVDISVDEKDDPYLIFESLNYKGEPLSEADLVRNYILMRFKNTGGADTEQREVYEKLWRPIEENVGDRIGHFLRHYCMQYGQQVKKNAVYSAIKTRLKSLNDEKTKNEATEMSKCSGQYRYLIKPELFVEHDVARRLTSIRDFDITTCFPYVLRTLRLYQQQQCTKDSLLLVLKYVESFAVRRLVCGVPSNSLDLMYLQWSKSLSGDPAAHLLQNMKQGVSNRRWPTDEEFKSHLLSASLYPRPMLRPFLIRIEESFEHRESADLSKTTIEHIMPQTLSDQWKADLGEHWADIYGQRLNTLGNLTLSAYNTEMRNSPFPNKREVYQTSNISMNRWLANKTFWTDVEIKERANMLAEKALQIWSE